MNERIDDTSNSRNQKARQTALAAMEKLPVDPTSLVNYRSRGRVAVIGNSEAMEFAPRLSEWLHPLVVLLEGAEEPGAPVVPVGGRSLDIEGYLGAFRIHLGEQGRPNAEVLEVDMILDLSSSPLLVMPLKPPGYLHSSTDEISLASAFETLAGMRGTFEKPRYFDYDPSLCAHGRSGKTACTRCLDTCPAGAITAMAESIEVDPYLCQGGGICATVCPSGAVRYTYPGLKYTLDRLRTLLRVYREQVGEHPVLAFIPEANEIHQYPSSGHLLPVVVEELASVGLDVWLSALAYGARTVLLVDGGSMSPEVDTALREQLKTTGEILQALGYPDDAVRLVKADVLEEDPKLDMPAIVAGGHSGIGGKRSTALMAIDHLFEQAEKPKPMVILSVGAPFGAAFVEAGRCTLCFSCVGVCPGRALQSGYEEPRLEFIESNCLQCGLCTRTCPEDAIWITPRLLFDPATRNHARLLHEEPPFLCTSCGKPFATRSVIDNMLSRLQGHWMFQNERARKRLTMCDDCRVMDIVQDPEAMESDASGQIRQ